MKKSLKHELGFQHLIQVKRPLIKLEEMKWRALLKVDFQKSRLKSRWLKKKTRQMRWPKMLTKFLWSRFRKTQLRKKVKQKSLNHSAVIRIPFARTKAATMKMIWSLGSQKSRKTLHIFTQFHKSLLKKRMQDRRKYSNSSSTRSLITSAS